MSPAPPQAPAFTFPDGRLLTTNGLLYVLQLTCRLLLDPDNHHVTMHSLRRGVVQACVSAGIPLDAIKEAGPWSSKAYLVYVYNAIVKKVPSTLGSLLG